MSDRKPYPRRGAPLEFLESALSSETDECLAWPYAEHRGYGIVYYEGQRWRVNRLVCTIAHGSVPSDIHEAAHSCGNARCANPNHLRWATPLENAQDKFSHNTMLRGEKIVGAKLTADKVREIRRLRNSMTCIAIAHLFGVTEANVSVIAKRKSWGWVE